MNDSGATLIGMLLFDSLVAFWAWKKTRKTSKTVIAFIVSFCFSALIGAIVVLCFKKYEDDNTITVNPGVSTEKKSSDTIPNVIENTTNDDNLNNDDTEKKTSVDENDNTSNEKLNKTDSKEIETNVLFCRKCGTKVDGGTMFCRKCGTKIEQE